MGDTEANVSVAIILWIAKGNEIDKITQNGYVWNVWKHKKAGKDGIVCWNYWQIAKSRTVDN